MTALIERLGNHPRFEFTSGAYQEDTFAVVRMQGFEALSRPFRFELVLVSDDAQIDLDRILQNRATLNILAADDPRARTPYHGTLAEFDQLHQAGGYTFYRAVLVPRLWQLSLHRISEVYPGEQSIPQIMEGILKTSFLGGNAVEFKLTGQYRARSFVCQYQESHLDFLSRWQEKEGMYYFFDHDTDASAERLIIVDDRLMHPAQALPVSYRPADELDTGLTPDSVQSFICRQKPLPQRVVVQDYNYRKASLPLREDAVVAENGMGEVMLYGENFRTPEEGQRYARIRAEELRCGARVFFGEATATGLRSGQFMDLAHHYRADFNGRYLVTEITHEGSQAGALLAGLRTPFNNPGEEIIYRNSFRAIPAATQFRPERSTAKPRVAGTMNATVDAEGSGEYAELDEYGQYKVQFPFDHTDKAANKASARVRMATPYSGSDHGMHFPLHKGAEVLLSFTDGDPDQPVIVGAVPNSQNLSMVNQQNPQDNVISTKGGNQVLMSDTKGKEVIWLNSPFHGSSIGIGSVDPNGGGSIYLATKGSSDNVSFGQSNTMSFGSKNSLSIGTESSLTAAFANKVNVGASIAINCSSDIKWNMNLLPMTDAAKKTEWGSRFNFKSVTLDDTDTINIKTSSKSVARDSAVIAAGVPTLNTAAVEVDAKLKRLRALVGAYTVLNFAQSACFGAAVTGHKEVMSPLVKEQKEENDKKIQEAKDQNEKQRETDLKQAEKDWGAQPDNQADEQKRQELEAKKPRTFEEQTQLDETTQKREKDLREKKKEIDNKYDSLNKELEAPSNPKHKGIMGWPGIIGKFTTDAVVNVVAMAAAQSYAKGLEADIKACTEAAVSKINLDEEGITQTVYDPGYVPTEPGKTTSHSKIDINRCQIVAQSGIGDNLDNAARISLSPNMINISSNQSLDLAAENINITGLASQDTGVFYSEAKEKISLKSTGAKIQIKPGQIKAAAEKLQIGYAKVVSIDEIPQYNLLVAKKDALEEERLALRISTTPREIKKNKIAEIDKEIDTTKAKITALTPPDEPMMHGLTLDDQKLSLTCGISSLEASNSGLTLKTGGDTLDFKPGAVSLTSDGLIKIG